MVTLAKIGLENGSTIWLRTEALQGPLDHQQDPADLGLLQTTTAVCVQMVYMHSSL